MDRASRLPFSEGVLTDELRTAARELGRAWATTDRRPRITAAALQHWDVLIEQWIADQDLPLAVRKVSSTTARGGFLRHASSREIVLTDNAPAQWAFSCAYANSNYSLTEIKDLIQRHKIPFAFATKKSDREQENYKYKGTVGSCGVDLNKQGWKLCHIDGVGLNSRTRIEDLPIKTVEEHFRLLLRPRNHFVVPKEWAGLGEIREVIEEIREFENQPFSAP